MTNSFMVQMKNNVGGRILNFNSEKLHSHDTLILKIDHYEDNLSDNKMPHREKNDPQNIIHAGGIQ